MKLIIAGTRTLTEYNWIRKAVAYAGTCTPPLNVKDITEVIHGAAKGIDTTAGIWAGHNNIPVKEFPAEWNNLKAKGAIVKTGKYGKYNAKAGFDRNEKMAKYGDALLAIIKDDSPGTKHMIETARQHDLQIWVYEV